jgi:hypothetical protein
MTQNSKVKAIPVGSVEAYRLSTQRTGNALLSKNMIFVTLVLISVRG